MTVKGGLNEKEHSRTICWCRRIQSWIGASEQRMGDKLVLTVGAREKETVGT